MTRKSIRFLRAVRGRPLIRKLIGAAAWATLFQVVSRFQAAVLVAVGARILTPEAFGSVIAVQSVALLGASVWDFGTTSLVMREVAAGGLQTRTAVRLCCLQRVVLALPYLTTMVLVLTLTGVGQAIPVIAIALLVLSAGLASWATVFNAVLLGKQQFARSTAGAAAGRLLSIAALPILFFTDYGDSWLAVAVAVILVGAEAASLVFYIFATRPILTDDATISLSLRTFIRKAAPHAGNSFFNYAYNKGDVLLVAWLSTAVAAAEYAPGSQLQNVLATLPILVAGGIVPIVSAQKDDVPGQQRIVRLSNRLSVVSAGLALFFCGFLTLFLPEILQLFIGSSLPGATLPALILIWVLPFVAAQVPMVQGLIAGGRASCTTTAFAVGFSVSLVMHFVLDPYLGAVGGAIASFVRDPIVLAVIAFYYLRMQRTAHTKEGADARGENARYMDH